MAMRDEHLSSVEKCLQAEYADGFKDGISYGVQVAEGILAWFLVNPQLKEPQSIETLEKWSRDAIKELKSKL